MVQEGITPVTVTVAVQVAVLPLLSVTVRVTLFVPILEQLKLVLDKVNDWIPQASLQPSLISEVVILAVPLDNVTFAFLQIAVGDMLSLTVTIAVADAVFPLASVTVNVTVFAPTFEQSKLVFDKLNPKVPEQLSDEPLFIAAAVVEATPLEFKLTETFCVITVGAWLSITVTV